MSTAVFVRIDRLSLKPQVVVSGHRIRDQLLTIAIDMADGVGVSVVKFFCHLAESKLDKHSQLQ